MRTNKENGVADEAIVNEWVVSIAPGDFEVVKSDGVVHCSVLNIAALLP